MPALAITDHGNMFGAIEFYSEAMTRGIKPIIGMEAYVTSGSHKDRPARKGMESYYHLLLLARNAGGYHNLMKLSTASYVDGFYYKPRVDKELLREHSEGLLACTACLRGEPAQHVLAGNDAAARESIIELAEIFGKGHLYLETCTSRFTTTASPRKRPFGKPTCVSAGNSTCRSWRRTTATTSDGSMRRLTTCCCASRPGGR
jgi:DNA polymerase-3 subunit alpha